MDDVRPGTGMAGMEAALINVLEPGTRRSFCVHGAFGERMVNICERASIAVRRVDAAWGAAVQPEQVAEALRAGGKVVAIVPPEASTGVLQPLEEIAGVGPRAGRSSWSIA